MRLMASIILILSLFDIHAFGQRSLTKDEIFKYWNLPSDKRIDSNLVVDSDSALNVSLINLVDSFQASQVDSLIIFSTAYPGYSSTSKCDTGIFPITSFVIWNKDGLTHIRKLHGNCISEITKSTLQLFDLFDNKRQKLESEIFMPVIFSGQLNKDETVSYSFSWIDHEPNYSFFYNIDGNSNSFHFCQSYLENKRSLFWNYNLSLSAYHWWQQVKNEIDKFD